MSLSNKLNMLTGKSGFDSDAELSGIDSRFNPMEIRSDSDSDESIEFDLGELSIDSYLKDSGYKNTSKKTKKKNKHKSYQSIFGDMDDLDKPEDNSRIDKIVKTTTKLIQSGDLMDADDFDDFLDNESIFSAEEDAEMRNNLISLGRKYARETASAKETSEISKTFADSEKRLKLLYEEIDRDKGSLQKDIDRMRVPGRGGKMVAELINAKNSMQSTQLSIVKEVNNIRKAVYDMHQKAAAKKEAENSGNSDINANTLQSIFSSSRSGLVNAMGGYAGISGALADSGPYANSVVSDEMDDDEIQRRYFNDTNVDTVINDGSKFLQYEDRGVEYVLLLDTDDHVQGIIAEDRDGVMIPDYPLPNDIDGLNFEIDHHAKMATDNLHRNYRVRIID